MTMVSTFEDLCGMQDVFINNIVLYLTKLDLVLLRLLSTVVKGHIGKNEPWKLIGERDMDLSSVFSTPSAPLFDEKEKRFVDVVEVETWEDAYKGWVFFNEYVDGGVHPKHLLQSVRVWKRLTAILTQNIASKDALPFQKSAPSKSTFREFTRRNAPSSLKALYAVRDGKMKGMALLGAFSVYDMKYAMFFVPASLFFAELYSNPELIFNRDENYIPVGWSPGHQSILLLVHTAADNHPEGHVVMATAVRPTIVVCKTGILDYLEEFTRRLEAGVYTCQSLRQGPNLVHATLLFPESGPEVSDCTTNGVRVRASSLVMPQQRPDEPLSFAYSIRITLTETGSACQLISRHWQFMDGNGNVRRVDGEGVIGKNPLLQRNGYVDLGVAYECRGQFVEGEFRYQSLSGPVAGTGLAEGSGQASVSGTLLFAPGSMENPTGPPFHVTVGRFPLTFSLPKY